MTMRPLKPGSWIGIIGGGQLGRMTALAAYGLGYRVRVWDPNPQAPAAQVAEAFPEPWVPEAARRFADGLDVMTYEFENIPVETAAAAADVGLPLYPSAAVLAVSRNRLREKAAVRAAGLETAPYVEVTSSAAVVEGIKQIGAPAILKTAEGGYDGKGQVRITEPGAAESAWREFGPSPGPCVLEGLVSIAVELSVICARDAGGRMVCYGPIENRHQDGILDVSLVPGQVPEEACRKALAAARRLAEFLQVIGLLTVEFFWTQDGQLLVNETAPRPHNSGHYSIEGATTSQFEQLVRIVAGLPLGETASMRPTVMVNLLGDLWQQAGGEPRWARVLEMPGTHLHLYGKSHAAPGRKMGHLTVVAEDLEDAVQRALGARRQLVAEG